MFQKFLYSSRNKLFRNNSDRRQKSVKQVVILLTEVRSDSGAEQRKGKQPADPTVEFLGCSAHSDELPNQPTQLLGAVDCSFPQI